MALLIFTVIVTVLWIQAVIDYHNDPPTGISGGMI